MAKYVAARNNFMFGEVSPEFYGRNDIEQYRQMCKEIKNFIVKPQGGVTRRPGTFLACTDTDLGGVENQDSIKMIPFYVDEDNSYVIVLGRAGSDFLKFYSARSTVSPETGTTVSQYDASGGTYGTDYTLTFSNSDIQSLQYSQYGNYLIITHREKIPLVIVRVSGTFKYFLWSYGEITTVAGSTVFSLNSQHRTMAWEDENTSATTITPSATTGTAITLTASTSIFTAAMASSTGGRATMFRIRSGSTHGVALVTAYTSGTVVTASVLRTLPGTAAYTTWSESSWSARKGYPSSVAFFDGRLCWAGTSADKDKIWLSQLGDLYETSPNDISATLTTEDAFNLVPLNESASGSWLCPVRDLLFGTSRALNLIDQIDEDLAVGLDNAKFETHISEGFARVSPVRSQNSVVALDLFQRRLKEIYYDFRTNGFVSADLGYFSQNIIKERDYVDPGVSASNAYIAEIIYSGEPFYTIWARTKNGKLLGLTRHREYNVLAWHHHTLGGSFAGGEPKILAMTSVNGHFGDRLHLAIRRTVNGTATTMFETFEGGSISRELFDTGYLYSDPNGFPAYLDCAKFSLPGTAQTAHVFSHLPSTELSVMADGQYVGEYTTDANGTITLDTAAQAVIAGFKYTSKIKPLALESNSLFGNGIGQIKRSDEVSIVFYDTVGAKFGSETDDDADDLQEIQFRESSVVASDPTPLFTGIKTRKLRSTYERDQAIVVAQEDPYPCNISSVITKGVLYD